MARMMIALCALALAACQPASVNPYMLPGVSELPDPVLSNEDLAELVGIVDANDYEGMEDHPEKVAAAVCEAYSSGCGASNPFFMRILRQGDFFRPDPSWRLVNVSLHNPYLAQADGWHWNLDTGRWEENPGNAAYVVITGNYGYDQYFRQFQQVEELADMEMNVHYIEDVYPRVRDGHKILYVASLDPSGTARWHQSTGCGGIESICVYAPWAPVPGGRSLGRHVHRRAHGDSRARVRARGPSAFVRPRPDPLGQGMRRQDPRTARPRHDQCDLHGRKGFGNLTT